MEFSMRALLLSNNEQKNIIMLFVLLFTYST